MTKEAKYTPEQVREFVHAIKQNVELFDRGIEGHIHSDAVLVLGSTGSGKSTIMNMFAGKHIEAFKEKGAFRVDVVSEKDAISGEIMRDSDGKVIRNYAGEIKAENAKNSIY